MGSASDRSPDPTRTANWARPTLPTGPRGTLPIPSFLASPPFGRQPEFFDYLCDALHARQYSPRTKQGYRHTMLPEAEKGRLWEHLARVAQIHHRTWRRDMVAAPRLRTAGGANATLSSEVGDRGFSENHLRPRLRLPTAPNPLPLVVFLPLAIWRLRLTLGQLGGHRRKPDNPYLAAARLMVNMPRQ
jgi:hypothetical protein